MLISIDPSSPVQLADQVARPVRAGGSISPRDRLPPPGKPRRRSVLACTPSCGYQQLRDEGLVELRRGRGAIVTDAGNSLHARTDRLARDFTAACRHLGLTADQTLDLVRNALQHLAPHHRLPRSSAG